MRYILESYYKTVKGEFVRAEFVVYDPVVTDDGIWCTHPTAWGGMVRHFHKLSSIIDFRKDD